MTPRLYRIPPRLPRAIRAAIRRLAAAEGRRAARRADYELRVLLSSHALDLLAAGRDRADVLAEMALIQPEQ